MACGPAGGGGATELVPGQAVQGGLKDTLVGLHGLWGEGHRGKGMRAAGNTHLAGFHFKDVSDAGKDLVGDGEEAGIGVCATLHLHEACCSPLQALL